MPCSSSALTSPPRTHPSLPSLKLSYRLLLLLLADKGPPSFVYLLLPRHGRRGKGKGGRGNCQKFFCPTDFSSPSSVSQQGTRERGPARRCTAKSPLFSLLQVDPFVRPLLPSLPPIKRSLSPSLRRSSISLPPRPRSSFPKRGKTKVALSPSSPFPQPACAKNSCSEQISCKVSHPTREIKEGKWRDESISQHRAPLLDQEGRDTWMERKN